MRACCQGRVKTALVLKEARKVQAVFRGGGDGEGELTGFLFDQLRA